MTESQHVDFGWLSPPTKREVGMRTALHNYPERFITDWCEKNIALIRRRSVRGAIAAYIGQLDDKQERVQALGEIESLEIYITKKRQELLRQEYREFNPVDQEILSHLSPFRKRFLKLLWDNEGLPLAHSLVNRFCSNQRDEDRIEEAGSSLMTGSRSSFRKVLRASNLGSLYSIRMHGLMFLTAENQKMDAEVLSKMQKSGTTSGVYGMPFSLLNYSRPNVVPYDDFFKIHNEVGSRVGNNRNPQDFTKTVPRLNKFAGEEPYFAVLPERGVGYSMYTWNDVPRPWLQAMLSAKLWSRQADLLVHVLSKPHKSITPEEAIVIAGARGDTTPTAASRKYMTDFIARVRDRLGVIIDAHKDTSTSGQPITHYETADIPAGLLAYSHPGYELHRKAVALGGMTFDRELHQEFENFDPVAFEGVELQDEFTVTMPENRLRQKKQKRPTPQVDQINEAPIVSETIQPVEEEVSPAVDTTSSVEVDDDATDDNPLLQFEPSEEVGYEIDPEIHEVLALVTMDDLENGCRYLPQTEQKLAVIRGRRILGLPLFHRNDFDPRFHDETDDEDQDEVELDPETLADLLMLEDEGFSNEEE